MKIKPKSLYIRLALLGSSAALISVMGLGGYIAYRQGKQVKQIAQHEARIITTGLANAFAEDMIVKNYAGIEQTLMQSSSYPSIVKIQVINHQGKLIVEASRNDSDTSWNLNYAIPVEVPSGQQLISFIKNERIVTWAPILLGDLVGWISTEMPLNHVAIIQNQIIKDTVVASVISLVFSMLVVILVLRRPILQIRNATKFAAELPDHYGHSLQESSSAKELEHLINALNNTSKKLFEQDQDIRMMRALIEYSNDPVYVLDANDGFRMIFANNATCRHYELSRETLSTLRVPDWDVNMDSVRLEAFWVKLKQQGSMTFLSQHRIGNGDIIPVEISANYIQFGHQHLIAGYFRDIRDRVRAEYELKQSRDMAEKSAKVKSEFLANMSHEIRTPMNGIIGLTQLALNEPLTMEARDCLNKITYSSENLLVILNDILELSRLEAGGVKIEYSPFDLCHVIEQLKSLFEESARAKHLDFIVESRIGVSTKLLGDSTRIQQIISNLLGNAIKFTETGFVSIIVQSENISDTSVLVIFSVRDSGIGIAEKDLKKLFKPFSQVDASITRRFGGSGLGLAISRNLLQRMGGDFSVVSELGKGTIFSFALEFELALMEDADIQKKAIVSKPGELKDSLYDLSNHLRGKRVLVVEDNRINQKVISGFLGMSGIEVTIAENGREALVQLHQQLFDAVLMDIQMPVMDGKEATSILRKDPKFERLPIIALTAGVTDEEKESYVLAGLNDLIAKPVKPDILISVLKEWIR